MNPNFHRFHDLNTSIIGKQRPPVRTGTRRPRQSQAALSAFFPSNEKQAHYNSVAISRSSRAASFFTFAHEMEIRRG
jgi:hypothetical protein